MRKGPHQAHDRLHGFEEQQHGEVNRHDDEQAANQRVLQKFPAYCIHAPFLAWHGCAKTPPERAA